MAGKRNLDIYQQKSIWKWYLGILGIIIILISVIFTTLLTKKLAEEEKKKIEIWLQAHTIFNQENEAQDQDTPITQEPMQEENVALEGDLMQEDDFTFKLNIIQSNTSIPLLLVDAVKGVVLDSKNYSERQATDTSFLAAEYERLKKSNTPRIESGNQILYYKQSRILTLLQIFPYIQMLLIGFFVAFGYISFNNARRSEQNQVWAGMAKETAHQLGTPISAILGWMELLETTKADDAEVQEVVVELRNDVQRLELITDRFSKIGSSPELTKVNLYEVLHESKEYMQRRAPRKIEFIFPAVDTYPPHLVPLNVHLFAWVIENLIRNALDAMDNKGIIAVNLYEDNQYVNLDVSDTGKGIPVSKWKTVFQPGYSTKKRGWGLGLSLAKRIIEEYHKGKIFVKESKEDVGTTFTIKLPKA